MEVVWSGLEIGVRHGYNTIRETCRVESADEGNCKLFFRGNECT
jgi:hypothetical protein